MGIRWEILKKYFPALAREIKGGLTVSIPITGVRSDIRVGERISRLNADEPRFWGYVPDVIDFIRRCDTEEQALEIIDFLEKRGEISREYANKLRRQLKEKGLK